MIKSKLFRFIGSFFLFFFLFLRNVVVVHVSLVHDEGIIEIFERKIERHIYTCHQVIVPVERIREVVSEYRSRRCEYDIEREYIAMARGTFLVDLNVYLLLMVKFQSTDAISAARYLGQYGRLVNSVKTVKSPISMIPAEADMSTNLIALITSLFMLQFLLIVLSGISPLP